jgi:hypothetical protein
MIRGNLVGQRFGRWTVVAMAGVNRWRDRLWLCQCMCGQTRLLPRSTIVSGESKSCGCLARELVSERATRHGWYKQGLRKELNAWKNLVDRCENPRHAAYERYGGRGIAVCERWRNNFEAFLADMGPCPGPGYSIDRKDNDRGYQPDNCRWATWKEQERNRRGNRMLTYAGRTLCLSEWSEVTGLNKGTIHSRLSSGSSIDQALSEPPNQ